MKKEIIKRLFYSFLIASAISMLFALINYLSTTGLEAKQGMFIIVLVTFGINILNFILSLTALLNVNKKVRENVVTSMLSFLIFTLGLLIILISKYVEDIEHTTIQEFLLIGLPFIASCLALTYQFYRFRQQMKRQSIIK